MKNLDNKTISLAAVGDLGLIGEIRKNIKKVGVNQPFDAVSGVLKDADIVFGNLEMPFCPEGDALIGGHQSKHFYHDDLALESIKKAGFTILSIANNHIMECGKPGLKKTINLLTDNKIFYVGAGLDLNQASLGTVLSVKGIKLGFLAYSMPSSDSASNNKPGFAPINIQQIEKNIYSLSNEVDFLIVSLHFGMMYMDAPTPEDVEKCHQIIDAGADVILGHHPHVLQGIEEYKNGLIVYSLGEFVFDRTSGVRYVDLGSESRRKSMIVELYFNKNNPITYNIVPTYFNDNFQVELVPNEKKQQMLNDIELLSNKIKDGKNFYKNAGSKLVGYELSGLFFHLKKGNYNYVFSKLKNVKVRHFKLLYGSIMQKMPFFK